MTDKQKRFCNEYIKCENATQAALKAGYSPNGVRFTASRVKNLPEVAEFIKKHLEKAKNEAVNERILTETQLREFLSDVIAGKEKCIKPYFDELGDLKELPYIDQKNQLKALELLGKSYGMFKDKIEQEGTVNVTFIDDLED